MTRKRALQVVLAIVGLLFTAAAYPMVMIVWRRDQSGYTDAMMASIYATLGILLLMSVRNPVQHRRLIAFAAWSSLAHAALMTVMALRDVRAREYLPGVAIFGVIGVVLAVLLPAARADARASAAGA
jgi:hypothetical protein